MRARLPPIILTELVILCDNFNYPHFDFEYVARGVTPVPRDCELHIERKIHGHTDFLFIRRCTYLGSSAHAS